MTTSARARYDRAQKARSKKPRPARRQQAQPQLVMQQEDRKPVNRSFIARAPGTCASCHLEVKVGDRARFNPAGELVHHRHEKAPEAPVTVCQRCWLTPCDCD